MKSWLTAAQRKAVEDLAPERIQIPGGPKARLVYQAGGPPAVSVRIQDLYGVQSVLRLPDGRTTVLIHVLGPNHRPVQVTQDLSAFWREAYPGIKAEMQKKYPRHEWR